MHSPTIYYIRHGETDWNAQKRFQGRQDIALNPIGQAQADENGRKLAELVGKGENLEFISSPLGRTRETMERVRTQLGLDAKGYAIEDRLIERSYGDFEGMELTQIKRDFNEIHRFRKANRWDFTPENGETHDAVLERMVEWHNSLTSDCVVTAHGAVGRVLRYYLLGAHSKEDREEAGKFAFPHDQIWIIQKGRERFV